MSTFAGVIVLAVLFFAPVALGAGTAWLVYRRTKKRWTWLLTPVFSLVWFAVASGPLIAVGLYLPYRQAMRATRPPVPPPPVRAELELAPTGSGVPEEAGPIQDGGL